MSDKFPFYFTFDTHMRIQEVGKALIKVMGNAPPILGEEIQLESPKFPLREANFSANLDKEYFFKLATRGIHLRGSLQFDKEKKLFVFHGGPWYFYEGIINFDLQGVVTSWSPACFDIFGYTPEEMCGQHISLLFPDRFMEDLSAMLEDIREGSAVERHETIRLKKGGEEVHISQIITPIIGANEQIIGGSCLTRDITARRQIEEDVKRRDRLLQGINKASHYLLTSESFRTAIGHAISSVARAVQADMLSVQFEDQKGEMENQRYIWRGDIEWTKELAFIPHHWKQTLDLAEPVYQTGGFTENERHFFVLPNAQSLLLLPFLVDGEYAGYISIENKEERQWQESEITLLSAFSYALVGSYTKEVAEERVRLSEEKFRRVFDVSTDGIFVVNTNEDIQMLNPAAEEMLQTDATQAQGQKLELYLSPDLTFAMRADSSSFPVEVSLSQDGLVGVIRDITERKNAERQLALAREKEIDIGFRIQHALLLGKPPDNLKGITISLVTVASQGIDGDFYDFFPHTRSEFDMLIGDVMGKGIPAALLGAATKSAFNHAITTLTSTKGKPEPTEILDAVHAIITQQMIELESFMTIFYARFNNSYKRMTFVDCGHTNTLHFRKQERRVDELRGLNVPLGFLEKEKYEQIDIPYDYGDIFVFYSDGVTEARNKQGEFFGIERLKAILMKSYQEAGEAIVKEVTSNVERFSESPVFEDDLTLIVVKVEEKALQLEYMETLQLPKNLDYLETLRRAIVKFTQRATEKTEPLKIIELELATNEVFTNIVRHSQDPEATVEVLLEMYIDRIRIHFDFKGSRFEPQKIEPPAYDEGRSGGFGLYIIQKMVDEVSYVEIEKGRQRVTLTKYLA